MCPGCRDEDKTGRWNSANLGSGPVQSQLAITSPRASWCLAICNCRVTAHNTDCIQRLLLSLIYQLIAYALAAFYTIHCPPLGMSTLLDTAKYWCKDIMEIFPYIPVFVQLTSLTRPLSSGCILNCHPLVLGSNLRANVGGTCHHLPHCLAPSSTFSSSSVNTCHVSSPSAIMSGLIIW